MKGGGEGEKSEEEKWRETKTMTLDGGELPRGEGAAAAARGDDSAPECGQSGDIWWGIDVSRPDESRKRREEENEGRRMCTRLMTMALYGGECERERENETSK